MSERFYHVSPRRDWRLATVEIGARGQHTSADHVTISLATEGYAHFVSATVADPMARYPDNYIDILPGCATDHHSPRQKGPINLHSGNARTRVIELP